MSAEIAANIPTHEKASPSIFEILASDGLSSLLQPTFEQLFQKLANWRPHLFQQSFVHRTKLWLAVKSSIDIYFLKLHDSSLTECFYGLYRQPSHPTNRFWRHKSWFFVVIFPLLKQYLDNLFENLKLGVADGEYADQSVKSQTIRIFVFLYPWLHFTWSLASLSFFILFVLKKSRFPTIEYRLADVQILVKSQDPSSIIQSVSSHRLLDRWCDFLSDYSWRGFTTAVVLLQFLNWWEQQTSNTDSWIKPTYLSKDIPPPIKYSYPTLPQDPNLCPICMKGRRNPAVINISGVVYCYSCIYKHLLTSTVCPVSQYSVTVKNIRRLFDDDR